MERAADVFKRKKVMYLYRTKFDAAHYIPGHEKCGSVHGHTYRVRVFIESSGPIDFNEIDSKMSEIIDKFDHKMLGGITAEEIAEKIFDMASAVFKVKKVVLFETDKYAVVVSHGKQSSKSK